MINILNLGAGVQSSTLALMLDRGILEPKPDVAIHANTQSDPPHVMEMIEWLSVNVSYPINVVTHGNVAEDLSNFVNSTGQSYSSPPLYIKHADGKKGMGRRQCTREYKIQPIERETRRLLGLEKYKHWPKHPVVTNILGISIDEIIRAKDSSRPAIVNLYPLIDAGMSRDDCLTWWADNAPDDAPEIGRSACFCCPYQSTNEWRSLKQNYPDLFEKAVEIDASVRNRIDDGEMFLHQACVPLEQAIEIGGDEESQFGNECEGMCGV